MIRRPPRSTHCISSAASDVYKRQAQHVGADLLGSHAVATDFYPSITVVGRGNFVRHQVDVFLYFFFHELATNQAFDGVERVFGVGDGLTFGRGTHQHFAIFLVGDDGRCGTGTFGVFNHFGHIAFHDGHAAVGGAQIDTDDSSHDVSLKFGDLAALIRVLISLEFVCDSVAIPCTLR
eukprot:TRINITY_DN2324_c0_g1_i1.p1 TRINITY_DN2324_c0_g1~~TRINITY_DN2324_c0_g1_i1.p1  ORF type:complete len:178 (-),score=25.16 TRINITY_DN2324_c0_g1_i1:167-700(-)